MRSKISAYQYVVLRKRQDWRSINKDSRWEHIFEIGACVGFGPRRHMTCSVSMHFLAWAESYCYWHAWAETVLLSLNWLVLSIGPGVWQHSSSRLTRIFRVSNEICRRAGCCELLSSRTLPHNSTLRLHHLCGFSLPIAVPLSLR